MSEATFKHAVDAAFFEAWADVVGGIDATYTSPRGVITPVQVLVDHGVLQFGDDLMPVSAYSTFITFRRDQIEPEPNATLTLAQTTYTLAQRVDSSDASLSKWAVRP
ncbi:hypothetical protein AA93_02175 [Xylella fastidiosa subsp. pauca 11399]|uniref:head-tail joining protein n=1 Tax=Xylella fastidiosa TaxID=2371 RepID=UPI00080AF2DA|nr:hypothetical protein [Xylella fastidiosa]NRP55803.1 hypothetical protein [Xylella fastidiosa]OCA58666.1 hypothetical protein AA93_02175 [Xylella fastidiosa subsp. pauca 11399]